MKQLMLMLAFAASGMFAQQQFYAGQTLTRGNVTLSVAESSLPKCYRLEIESKDKDVNAFVVTIRRDYNGYLLVRQITVSAPPALLPLTTRRIAVIELPDISSIRALLIEEQKTSSSVEF